MLMIQTHIRPKQTLFFRTYMMNLHNEHINVTNTNTNNSTVYILLHKGTTTLSVQINNTATQPTAEIKGQQPK
jgi:hypothetical protein